MRMFVVVVSGLVIASQGVAAQAPAPSAPPRTVTLSLAEYNRLVDLGARPVAPPDQPPVASVVASADLRVRVDEGTARGVFTIAGDVLLDGVARVPLIGAATLIEAASAGRAVPLVSDNGVYQALIDGPTPFTIALGWGAPVMQGAGRASFVVPVPKAGAARATIDLPGDQADIQVTPGLVTGRTVANGRTLVDVTLAPGSPSTVSWSMRDSVRSAPARELRATADVLTLITLGESDVRMAALVDVTLLQGELRTLEVRFPAGYELTSVSGSSIATSTPGGNGLLLTLGDPAARSHQFLVSFERPHTGGSFAIDTGVVTLPGLQRELGEIAIEGAGAIELTADGRDGVHRMDVREVNSSLQALAAQPLLSAFRYQRAGAIAPAIALDIKRFADAGVLAAVADRAEATTLITAEGRALTEIKLQVQKRAQPFLKVLLPTGATMVSVEVAGESAKPVTGTDGTRVPLLRPGFRPTHQYDVSFVYLHAGTPLARKGEIAMTLPRLDLPIGIVHWEVFVPDRYAARAVAGNAIDLRRYSKPGSGVLASHVTRGIVGGMAGGISGGAGGGVGPSAAAVSISAAPAGAPGQILGRAADDRGQPLPGVTVTLETAERSRTFTTAPDGSFGFTDVPAGAVSLTANLAGFHIATASVVFDGRPRHASFVLRPLTLAESVTVSAAAPGVDIAYDRQPSQNVVNLQRRTSGVLPIRVDVPRAGTSHRFVKPLVIDQETTVTLRYKRR